MFSDKEDVCELFARAKAIHFAMRHGAITYEQAKCKTKPMLFHINKSIEVIAKSYKVKPKFITFQDLAHNL